MAPRGRTRFQKAHEFDSESRHLVLLCRNEEGYRNLSYMVSQAFSGGLLHQAPHRHGPAAGALRRADRLLRLPGGVSCPGCWLAGDYDKAKAVALEMRELFGPDGYYLELQDHGIPVQQAR